MTEIDINVEIPEAFEPLFERARYKVYYGGRGGAKSWNFARALLLLAQNPKMLFPDRDSIRVLCTREIQTTIAESVHQVIASQAQQMGLADVFAVRDKYIASRTNGSRFIFTGLRDQDPEKIKSYEDIDIAWCEEANKITKRSWNILTPTIRKEGAEIWVSFNPELDTDEAYQRFVIKEPPPDSIVVEVSYRDNPFFTDTLDQERRHMKATDPDEYEHVWEGRPRLILPGAIYAKEVMAMMAKRQITRVPYDPMLPVHTVWDLGFNDATAIILFQKPAREVAIIGYYEESYTKYSDDVAWLNQHRYVWGQDWLPHDGRAKTKAAGGKSPKQILRALGRNPRIVPGHDPEFGIRQTRMLFPRVYTDAENAARLIECWKRYRRNVPTTTGEPAKPLHDEYSHGADATRHLAMCIDKVQNDDRPPPPSGPGFQPLDPAMGY